MLQSAAPDLSKVKVGLEATGHYSYNILGFLLDKGLATYVINPLHTNLFRKSTSLRRTKTDRVDARILAAMMMSGVVLTSYTAISYHNEELKSLTRYRFDKVQERAKLKQSVSRLVNILFPELEKLVPTLHMASVYTLLQELPGAKQIASCHLTRLANLLESASKGRYLKPAFGKVSLSKLRAPMVQKFYNRLQEENRSPKYIKNIHGVLHHALDIAVRLEYLQRNPASACVLPKVVEKEVTPLDAPEQKKLLEALKGSPFEALFLTALFTGMRVR